MKSAVVHCKLYKTPEESCKLERRIKGKYFASDLFLCSIYMLVSALAYDLLNLAANKSLFYGLETHAIKDEFVRPQG